LLVFSLLSQSFLDNSAQDIIAERISDNPKYRQRLLKDVYYQGKIVTTKKKQAPRFIA
jgi:transcriptional accessory protein Tex/SPT6